MTRPIKRSDHLIPLSKEHHFSLLFCWKVRKGIKLAVEQRRIVAYMLYFWKTHLLAHFNEEDILFKQVNDPLVQRAYGEHQLLNSIFSRLHSATPEEKSVLIPQIADLVDQHVRFEERVLFPHLEQAITEPLLAAIGRKLVEEQPEPLQDEYKDEFWKSPT